MNTVNLIGRWVRDHDMKFTAQGKAVLNNTIAVNRRFDKENSDFIRVVIFGKAAELAADYTSKGSQVGLIGRIQTGSYEKNDGTKVYTTDVIADQIIFLDNKKQGGQDKGQRYTADPGDPFQNDGQPIDISDDSLPF